MERMADRSTVVRRATYAATHAAPAMEAVAPMSKMTSPTRVSSVSASSPLTAESTM